MQNNPFQMHDQVVSKGLGLSMDKIAWVVLRLMECCLYGDESAQQDVESTLGITIGDREEAFETIMKALTECAQTPGRWCDGKATAEPPRDWDANPFSRIRIRHADMSQRELAALTGIDLKKIQQIEDGAEFFDVLTVEEALYWVYGVDGHSRDEVDLMKKEEEEEIRVYRALMRTRLNAVNLKAKLPRGISRGAKLRAE